MVALDSEYYSRAETKKSGASNKQLNVHSDGPFAVTKVHADKIHFEIDMPEWMQRRKDNRFTIKSIKAIKEEHPDPTAGVRDAVENDAGGAEELSEGNFVITELWARRYDVKKKRYEYKVLWAGCPASEASFVAEDQIDAKELMSEFDEKFPRGSVKTDSNEDKKLYLKANPGLLELKRTAATSPTSTKKATNDTGDRRSTSRQGRRATKTYGDAPGGTSTRSTRGRVRRPPTRLELSLHDQRRLHDHLLYLFDNDIDHYEMAIHDWDHTHEVLRQDYDLDYTTGWDADFNEHTYIPPDTLVANMRHGEGPDGGGGRDND